MAECAPASVAADSSLVAAAAKEENIPDIEPLPATPVPAAVSTEAVAQVKENEIAFHFGDRRYSVRGLAKNTSYETSCKVNLLAAPR